MSIRFLKADNTVGVVRSPTELFDPRLNDNFPSAYLFRPWRQVLNLFNQFYCQENVENYEFAKIFLIGGSALTEEEHALLAPALATIPAEQRWLIATLHRRNRIGHPDCRITLYDLSYVNSRGAYVAYDTTQKNIPELTAEAFRRAFDEVHLNFKTNIFNRVSEETVWKSTYFYVTNSAISYYHHYFEGNKIFQLNGSGPIGPRKVLQKITEEEATLRLEYRDNDRDFRLNVVQTVSRFNRRPLHVMHNYSANALDILPWPNMEKKEKDPVLVGVELELCTDYTVQELIDPADEPFFFCKQDGSITGIKQYKYECVTAPSSFKYLKRQYALWFNKLDYSKFDTTTDTNNGLHVHVGRDHFEDNTHIRNFCWFFNNPANTEFLLYISERTRDSLNRWAPVYSFPMSYTRTKAFKDVYRILGQGFRGITNFKGGWDLAKTIEVRMFKGVVSYAAIVKNLEFVEAVFNFTKGLTSYRQMTLKGFLDWLKKTNANQYCLLKEFIKQKGDMKKLLLEADIKDWIFNEQQPEKIVRLLQRAPFKVTQDHISVLNKGKKRTYVMDKTTGEISISYHNRSKLHVFDKSFAERYLRNSTKAA